MNKKTLTEEFKKINSSLFLSRKEIAGALGYKDPHNIDHLIKGLEKINKKYFVGDVVEKILSERCM